MPRKWVRNDEWQRQPHSKEPPQSLWWHRRPDRQRVISAYLDQCSRGRAVPDRLKDDIELWLSELSSLQKTGPRTYRYWTIPAYARAHRMQAPALMKRVREMEK